MPLSCTETFWAPSNGMTGTIPQEISLLDKLIWLDLSGNNLRGNILGETDTLATLRKCFSCACDHQCDAIFSLRRSLSCRYLVRAEKLNLSDNRFDSTIPSGLGQHTALSMIDLHGNSLQGTLPWQLGRLHIGECPIICHAMLLLPVNLSLSL